ncbi:hypothetical protein SAMN05444161_1637 [Rhizobiales bacterium GAS191]|jgi:hypothetical protein|nr:hypothetical protein SAMN05519103_00740 [Rhizobiales bacterium GAS113]SEC59492.1 hypothetical protein SAMN05519104_1681 [Rhizobiales bacterium GAS188]SEC69067.1 hypothetical protein SAMN05444161_1637 [Rhizobiales bacterium GAS191]
MFASLQGFRTFAVGLTLAVAPSALSYLSGLDWNQHVGATGAFFVSGLLMLAMRFVTSTPPGSKP